MDGTRTACSPGPRPLPRALVAPVAYTGSKTNPAPPGAEKIIRWIMLAIVAWGVFHAIGAWRFNHDPRRMIVVLGCVAAFLGFWLVMLRARARRLEDRRG